MTALALEHPVPTLVVDAVEEGVELRNEAVGAVIGHTLHLDTEGLETYFFAAWDPALVDFLVVAAAAEFCDVVKRRPQFSWSRRFDVRVAVHDPVLWNGGSVRGALERTLGYLTGDQWSFHFVARRRPVPRIQSTLELPSGAKTIMPYSDGLDSRAVYALMAAEEGPAGLVRVRLGPGGVDQPSKVPKRSAFAVVPYRVRPPCRVESSARSRGFKFAAVTGVAALLAGVQRIVVTESGQGVFGPVLAVSGHTYPDYRVHPTFSREMERLFAALAGKALHYIYPQLWSTKGETLQAAARLQSTSTWTDTRSCWQQSRHTSVDHHRRQCGVCAACMLRRMSMFAAGIEEAPETYVWERLSAPRFEEGAAQGFARVTPTMRDYGVAGVLHLDHLADLVESSLHAGPLRREARATAEALGEKVEVAEQQLRAMLERHGAEWRAFRLSLGPQSFVVQLAGARP